MVIEDKNHGVPYNEVMEYVENLEETMKENFEKSNLPEEPDLDILEKILVKIRKTHYGFIKI